MTNRVAKVVLTGVLALANCGFSTASACPMCKAANEAPQPDGTSLSDPSLRPRAYMYSIFFMMSMPPVAGGLIALAIYRDVKKAQTVPAAV